MRMTYDDILDAMKTKFVEISGHNIDVVGDVGLRLQAVASELYSLSCYGDYVLRQAFPQTASSTYLDKHATLRNTSRKKAEYASVELVFSIPEPVNESVFVTSGTICACADKPFIQFIIDRIYVIRAGETSVTAVAKALNTGEEYNVPAGTVSVMVNPPAGISSVINPKASSGGFSGENDEMLRQRLVNSYKVPSTGFTITSMASVVESLSFVLECKIMKNGSALDVYVKTANNALTTKQRTDITNSLQVSQLLGFSVNIICVKPKLVGIKAVCKLNPRRPDNIDKILNQIAFEKISSNRIGKSFELDSLVHACLKTDGIDEISFTSAGAENGIISINNDEYLCLNGFEVVEYA